MNTDDQIRYDLLELADKSHDKIGIFELIKEHEVPLICKIDEFRHTMSIKFTKHSCNEVGCRRITYQKRDAPTETTFKALENSRHSQFHYSDDEYDHNISCLHSFDHHTFHEEDLIPADRVYLMIMSEYFQNCNCENINIRKTLTHSCIFNKIISCFGDEEIENNFCISYIDQRTYTNYDFQAIKRRKCLTYNLCNLLDFVTQLGESTTEEYKEIENSNFLDFLNLSQYYSLCDDDSDNLECDEWGSLKSARFILDTNSIRKYLPIMLEKGTQDSLGMDVTDQMIEIVNSKLSDLIELKHRDNDDLAPDRYRLVGVYCERDDGEIFSECFVYSNNVWINQESQFCYIDKLRTHQSVLIKEMPILDDNYFNFIETPQQSVICKSYDIKHNQSSLYESKLSLSREYTNIDKTRKTRGTTHWKIEESKDNKGCSNISVCEEDVDEYNYRFSLISNKNPKAANCLIKNFFISNSKNCKR